MSRSIGFGLGLLSAAALLVAAPAAGAAPGEMTITQFSASPVEALANHTGTVPNTQAGSHPDLLLKLRYCSGTTTQPQNPLTCPEAVSDQLDAATVKDLRVELPPGWYGDPTRGPHCPYAMFVLRVCGSNTVVGQTRTWAERRFPLPGQTSGITQPIFGNLYNVQPSAMAPALLGASVDPGSPTEFREVAIGVRTDGDFAVVATTPDIPKQLRPDPATDGLQSVIEQQEIRLFGTSNGSTPFMTAATSCIPGTIRVDANSWQRPDHHATVAQDLMPTGCTNVPFNASQDITPETTEAGAPSGYEIGVNVPESGGPIESSHVARVANLLPVGMALSTNAARTLQGCSAQQFGFGNDDPIRCPESSKVGTVQAFVPPIDADPTTSDDDPSTAADEDPLSGFAFFATPDQPGGPTEANPWRLYLSLEGAGLRVKLSGRVTTDPVTGRLRTIFENEPGRPLNTPQAPFTRLSLKLKGGNDAVFMNPRDCSGPHTLAYELDPWSSAPNFAAGRVSAAATFNTTGCSAASFQPTITGSSNPTTAGAATTSHLVIDRPNRDELIRRLSLSLPAGLVGSLAAVPSCELADLDANRCSTDSRIGRIGVAVGPGADPLQVSGSVYLAKPSVPGDAATVGVVIPGKVGPIDLGNVIVKNRVRLRQSDGGLDVESGAFPTALAGIPLMVRRITIDVDRDGFFRNPTGCEDRTLSASFESETGKTAQASFADHATGCENLPFKPKLRMIAVAKGETKRFAHPGLRAVVTQTEGEANISQSRVLLPQVLRPETVQFNKPGALCQAEQLAVDACPPLSQTGTATARTPLLPEPLSGPIYLVQHPGNPIPRLAVMLRGAVALQLDATNSFTGVRTTNLFSGIPDVPVTSFELNINGGRSGILKNFGDLCTTPDTADATFTAQSGRTYTSKPGLEVEGCSVTARAKLSRIARSAKVRNGRARIKLTCAGGTPACRGTLRLSVGGRSSFSIAAGKSKLVAVKLSVKTRKRLARDRRLRAKASIRLNGGATSKRALTIRR